MASMGPIRRMLSQLNEPSWAKFVVNNLVVERTIGTVVWTLSFSFLGVGGWTEGGQNDSAEYLGWRDTGVGKGDGDAWLTVYKDPTGKVSFHVYGNGPGGVTVAYLGVNVPPTSGPFQFLSL